MKIKPVLIKSRCVPLRAQRPTTAYTPIIKIGTQLSPELSPLQEYHMRSSVTYIFDIKTKKSLLIVSSAVSVVRGSFFVN